MDNLPEGQAAPRKRSAVIKWALILGIAIVLNLFLTYLVRVVYHNPEFDAFCPQNQVNRAILSEDECLKVGGQWNENVPQKVADPTVPQAKGYCDATFTCSRQFQDTLKLYNRNVFVVFTIAGFLLLVGSAFLSAAEAVSLGLSFGGVLALIIGSTAYWSDMNDILRVVVLGVALVGLVYVAYKKFRD